MPALVTVLIATSGFWVGECSTVLVSARIPTFRLARAGQIIWVWVVSLPLIILNSPAVSDGQTPAFGTASDILGIIMWVVGWAIESLADWQKFRYKATRPPKDRPIDVSSIWELPSRAPAHRV